MKTNRRWWSLSAAVCGVVWAGCGGSSEIEAVDLSKPLEGEELDDADDLEGTWLAMNEGLFIGFEFMDDGQVLITPLLSADGASVLYRYGVLDGGRLSLVTPNGDSQVFNVEISDDQFELQGSMPLAGTHSQRFARLPEGQTLQQGIEQYQKAREAEYQARHDAVAKFLAQPGLVIVPTKPAPGAPTRMALEVDASGSGKAWYDDQAPHLDQVSTSIDAPEGSNMPTVEVRFGQRIQPPTTQRTDGGAITFQASGDMDDPTLLAQVTFGQGNFELALKRDPGLHEEIVGRFDAEMTRVAALRQPIVDLLQDHAVLEGTSVSENPGFHPKGYGHLLVLTRNAEDGTYSGQATFTTIDSGAKVEMPKISAEVTLVEDKPMLLIQTPVRQYQLSVAEGGKLTGGWFPYGMQDGYPIELGVTHPVAAQADPGEAKAQ